MNNFEKLFDIRCKGKNTVEIAAYINWNSYIDCSTLIYFSFVRQSQLTRTREELEAEKRDSEWMRDCLKYLSIQQVWRNVLAFNYKVSLLATRS
jgi:hypothetical protein